MATRQLEQVTVPPNTPTNATEQTADDEAMDETPERRRTRILNNAPDTAAWEYALAVDLGYEPESWAGMWSLIAHPFTFDGNQVVAEQVLLDDQGKATYSPDGLPLTRKIRHPLPEDWTVIEDSKLTRPTASYTLISPAMASDPEGFLRTS